MPKTYTNNVNYELIEQSNILRDKLSQTSLENSGDLINNFMLKNQADVIVLNHSNKPIKLPTKLEDEFSKIDVSIVAETSDSIKQFTVSGLGTLSMSISQGYPFYFADSNEPYTLVVTGNMKSVNQVTSAMKDIMPWLVIAILTISLIGSLIYSRFVTQPIVKISRISARISKLDFDWCCKVGRKDEIGVLANSLNELSHKLSTTLSELQEANDALKDDIDRERELECKRLDFFTAVSHELKTPITVIKGQLEGMLNNVGDFRNRDKYLARSITVANNMEVMVQEILTISRMESSKFTLQSKCLDFSRLVHTQTEEYTPLIAQKELVLEQNIEDDIFVIGDKLLLKKVIANLISNAAHYSETGETILIEACKIGDEAKFSILNTNAYIPDEALHRLFEAFYRIDKSRNRQSGGSGLGLYIVKRILDQHNAKYKIENVEGGVRFTFTLPSMEV